MKKKNNIKELVILTGGKSKRMGSDKSSLPFGNCSVLEHIIKKFSSHFDKIYISTAYSGWINKFDIDDKKIKEVPDVIPGMGPLGGLYSVLKVIESEVVYVTAVDMPFADPIRLLELKVNSAESVDYRIIKSNGRIQPLFGWYSVNCIMTAEQMLLKNECKMMRFLELLSGSTVDIEESRYSDNEFLNMNDRESYYKALDIVRNKTKKIPLVSFAAYSGTGKTTIIERLIPLLKEKGIRTAVIKHDGHDFEVDVAGTDTYRFQRAGAVEVVITSPNKTAHIWGNDGDDSLETAVEQIRDVDLILVEGYKFGSQPKIEIYRSEVSSKLINNLQKRIAVIGDFDLKLEIPAFCPNQLDKVCEFLLGLIHNHKI